MLEKLPDSTVAAVVLPSLVDVATAIDWLPIFKEYKKPFAELNMKLTASGARLLEPTTLTAIGIDPKAPCGAAFLVETRGVGIFFAHVRDRELFLRNISEVAETLSMGKPEVSGQLVRFTKEEHIALLVQDSHVIAISADRDSDVLKVVSQLQGEMKEHKTLGESGRLAIAENFDFGEEAAGFIAFDTFAARVAEAQARYAGNSYWRRELEMYELRLEQAKVAGKPQQEIDAIEAELDERRREYNAQTLREAGEAHFLQTVVGSLGTVVFGVDLDGPATRARLRIKAPQGSFADRLFDTSGPALALPARLRETPVFMLGARVEKQALTEMLRSVLNMEGETLRDMEELLRKELHLDFSAWLATLQGEISGAITVDIETLARSKTTDEMLDAFGLHLLAETANQAEAEAFFATAIKSPELAPLLVAGAEVPTLEVPGFGKRPVQVSVSGKYFEAKTLPANNARAPWSASEAKLVTSDETYGVFAFDPMMRQWLVLSDYSIAYEMTMPARSEPVRATPEQVEKKRLKQQQLQAQLEELRRKRHRTIIRDFLSSSSAVGRLVAGFQKEPGGAQAAVGILEGKAPNLGRALQAIAESLQPRLEGARTGKPSERTKLGEELFRLSDEYRRISY